MSRPPAPPIPLEADERTMLNAFLDFYRAALLDRAYGLDREQLNATLPPSSLTIARLLAHMAWVEQVWYRVRFDGEGFAQPFDGLDFEADPDAEMTLIETWSASHIVDVYNDAITDSRARVAATVSLDDVSPAFSDGTQVEYALDHGAHDRGVRTALRARRSHPRIDRWGHLLVATKRSPGGGSVGSDS